MKLNRIYKELDKKHFEAILSKNRMARILKELREHFKQDNSWVCSKIDVLVFDLKEIEKVIGVYNQPCVNDILNK